jgi:hypothetical protein
MVQFWKTAPAVAALGAFVAPKDLDIQNSSEFNVAIVVLIRHASNKSSLYPQRCFDHCLRCHDLLQWQHVK